MSITAAFVLSSGTIGAAMSSSLCRIRSIALSYGTVEHTVPRTYFAPAHVHACRVIQLLWNSWGTDNGGLRKGEVDLYNVNIPMIEALLNEGGLKVVWTTIWRNSYGKLFRQKHQLQDAKDEVDPGGPDAHIGGSDPAQAEKLIFKFGPDLSDIINPPTVPIGTDAWALSRGWISITPLRASFAESPISSAHLENSEFLIPDKNPEEQEGEVQVFKFKL